MDSLIFLLTLITFLVLLNINKIFKIKQFRYIYLKYKLPKLRKDIVKYCLDIDLDIDILKILEKGIKNSLYTKNRTVYFINYNSITVFYKDRIIQNIIFEPTYNKLKINILNDYYIKYIDSISTSYLLKLIEYYNLLKLRKDDVKKIII